MAKTYEFPTAYTDWGQAERDAMMRVINSGQFTMGSEVKRAEMELAEYHARDYCVMVNSGSSANLLAVAAIIKKHKIEPGARIVAPVLAWPTTYSPFVQFGMVLDLVDCDDSWNMDTVLAEQKMKGASCVITANILGNPGFVYGLARLSSEHGVPFIEDNCESFGAGTEEGLCGTFSEVSTLSFYHSHQISGIEGGAILTDDPDIARMCRLLRNHGWTKGIDAPKSFQDEYRFVEHGYNLRPLEMHAAIVTEQVNRADEMQEARDRSWMFMMSELREIIPDSNGRFPVRPEGNKNNPFGFSWLMPTRDERDYLAGRLRAAGIDCRPVVGGCYAMQPYGKGLRPKNKYPRASAVHERGMTIGVPLTIERTEQLIDRIKEVMRP